jgi:hypothetical protein
MSEARLPVVNPLRSQPICCCAVSARVQDIKPDNFLMGPPQSSNAHILYMVDMGLCQWGNKQTPLQRLVGVQHGRWAHPHALLVLLLCFSVPLF